MTGDLTGTTTRDADAVARAARAIPAELYLGPDGDAVLPTTPAPAVLRQLRALDLRPGMRVLEIGTESGYSAALMGHVVGQRGHVLTVDPDEGLARRAGELFAEHGHHATAAVGDALAGHPGRAPYDRIHVRGTPAAIPAAWLDQLAPDGALITGCLVSDLPGTSAVAHLVQETRGTRVTVRADRYAPLGALAVPDTVTVATGPDNPRYHLATSNPDRTAADQLLAILRTGHAEPWPGTPREYLDLRNWLLARRPHGLFTAVTELGQGIGLGADHDGVPEVAMVTAAHLVVRPAGSPTAARLIALIQGWRAEGHPATHELDAVLLRDGDTCRVRLDD
jgi:protein-L-isoaspartate O-methyltransferase